MPDLLFKQKERLEPKLAEIGDTWEDLLTVVESLTTQKCEPPHQNSEWGKDVIIWGETPHGYDGLPYVERLLMEYPDVTLIISGGVYSRREAFNEIGAIDLFNRLSKSLAERGFEDDKIKERVIIDSMSMHTGHQRMIVGELLASLEPNNIWVVIQCYHMLRFLMTVSVPLHKRGFRKAAFWTVCYGLWEERHKTKAPLTKPSQKFTYEELMCLPPTPSGFAPSVPSEDEHVYNCGELDKIIHYASRAECLTFKQAREFFNTN